MEGIIESERYADILDSAAQVTEDTVNSAISRIRRLALPEQDGSFLYCTNCAEGLGERAKLGKRFCLHCQIAIESRR